MSKTGQQIHDPGENHRVYLPVFVFPPEYKESQSLQYGRELEFFLKHKPSRSREVLLGQAVDRYNIVTDKEIYLYLWVSVKSQTPVQIESGKGKYFQTIQYMSYERNLLLMVAILRFRRASPMLTIPFGQGANINKPLTVSVPSFSNPKLAQH